MLKVLLPFFQWAMLMYVLNIDIYSLVGTSIHLITEHHRHQRATIGVINIK